MREDGGIWVAMKRLCILLVVVAVQLLLSNVQNSTLKRVSFTVCKLNFKMRKNRHLSILKTKTKRFLFPGKCIYVYIYI